MCKNSQNLLPNLGYFCQLTTLKLQKFTEAIASVASMVGTALQKLFFVQYTYKPRQEGSNLKFHTGSSLMAVSAHAH